MTEAFHDHLDACEQCRNHPLALCAVGHGILHRVAAPLPAGPATPTPEGPLLIAKFCEQGKATAYEQLDKLEDGNAAHDYKRWRQTGRAQAFSEVLDMLASGPAVRSQLEKWRDDEPHTRGDNQ